MTSPEPGEMEDVVVEAAKAVGAVLYGADERSYKATSGRWDLCLLCAQAACAGLLAHLSRQEEEIKGLRGPWMDAGFTDLGDVVDMANVGRSLMDAIACCVDCEPLKGWTPADDPAEVVTDLVNLWDEQRTRADAADAAEAALPQVRRLIAAARPFAPLGGAYTKQGPGDDSPWAEAPDGQQLVNHPSGPTVGDFRALSAALSALESELGGEP